MEKQVGAGKRHWKKILIFLVIGMLIFTAINYIAQPVWTSWNNYNTVYGFYEEPENTIETIFLGSSQCVRGFTPMELYEEYGICAYNLGTEQQPLLASYYWMLEAYRLHGETLDTVVLEAQELVATSDNSFYRKALDGMQFSSVKVNAYKDYLEREETEEENLFSLLVPAFSYHDRWKSLTEEDFIKADYSPATYTRGFQFITTQWIQTATSYSSVGVLGTVLDESAEASSLNEESLSYFIKIVEFCNEHDIQLIVVKTPNNGWSSAKHNAVQEIADRYDVDFFDFCFSPYLDELDYNMGTDNTDGHMNYYGASKLTSWIGAYLSEKCENEDVRGETEYEFLDTELDDYHRSITKVSLDLISDPCEYLEYLIESGNYTVLITVKDSASSSLTDQQREALEIMGLTELSELGYRESYLAVISNGEVIVEKRSADKEITFNGKLDNGLQYSLTSAGMNAGNVSSCIVDGTEYSLNTRGINIVVYDNYLEEITDEAVFDTHASSTRESPNYGVALQTALDEGKTYEDLSDNEEKLYLYNRYYENTEKSTWTTLTFADNDLISYLDFYMEDADYEILISVKDEASNGLTEDVRAALYKMGFSELSEISYRDSYIAIVSGGTVLYEESGHDSLPLDYSQFGLQITSGGAESGDVSSIKILGTEYSPGTRGINIVVYDTVTNKVVNRRSFDTHEIKQQTLDD